MAEQTVRIRQFPIDYIYLDQFSKQLNLDSETRSRSKSNLKELLEREKQIQDEISTDVNLVLLSATSIYFSGHQINNQISGINSNTTQPVQISRIIEILPPKIEISKFLQKLWDSTRKLNFDSEKQSQINKYIKVYIDSCSIYNKYNNFFKSLKLTFKEQNQDQQQQQNPIQINTLQQQQTNNSPSQKNSNKDIYEENLYNLIWLIYLNLKIEVMYKTGEGDQILFRNISVLITTILQSILNFPDSISSQLLENCNLTLSPENANSKLEKKQQINAIISDALSKSNIDAQTINYYEEKVLQTMQKLRKIMMKKLIKNSLSDQQQNQQKSSDFQNLFDLQSIEQITEQFKQFYKQSIEENAESEDSDELQKFDESCFLKGLRPTPAQKDTPDLDNPSVPPTTKDRPHDFQYQKYIINEQLHHPQYDFQTQSLKDAKNNMIGNGFQSPNIHHLKQSQPAQSPITPALERYKWIIFYSKNECTPKCDKYMKMIGPDYQDKLLVSSNEIMSSIHSQLGKSSEEARETRVNRNLMFFLNVLERMISTEEQIINEACAVENIVHLLKNGDFLSSLLAMCIDCFCFIHNLEPDLLIILEKSKVTAQDYWRVISNFARFDKQMHQSIMEHLFNRERVILLYYAWNDGKSLASIFQAYFLKNSQPNINNININIANSSNVNSTTNIPSSNNNNNNDVNNYVAMPYHQILCKRIFNHIALRVYEICKLLLLIDQYSEQVWKVMKHIFEKENTLLFDHYIDQLIICSIYAVYMANKLQFKERLEFKKIISAFEELEYFKKELIVKVKITDPENSTHQKEIDIITFYNKIYLPPIKEFFRDTKDKGSYENVLSVPVDINQVNKFKHLASPLRESIPRSFYMFSPIYQGQQESPQVQKSQILGLNSNNINKTPGTNISKTLYAFGETLESPAKQLTEHANSMNRNSQRSSHREINFDDEEDSFRNQNRPNRVLARKIMKQSQESQGSPKYGVISEFQIKDVQKK